MWSALARSSQRVARESGVFMGAGWGSAGREVKSPWGADLTFVFSEVAGLDSGGEYIRR